MVVLAILAFAFTYGIIHLDGATGTARISSAARQIGTTLEFLRGFAVQSARPVELHVNLDRGEWWTVVPPRPSESEKDRQDDEEILVTEPVGFGTPAIRFDAVQFDPNDQQSSGDVVITFSALGEMSPNGLMIRLVSDEVREGSGDPQEGYFSIEVNGLTGEVSYTPGTAKFEQVVKGESF
jgi:Tfp pilus assembly protein FimT